MRVRTLVPLALAGALALTLTACSSSKHAITMTTTTAPGASVGGPTTAAPGSSESGATLQEIEKRGKPKVDVPSAPATKLEIKDLVVGTGAEVGANATVTVHYVGVGQADGKQFDASWDRGQPISFPLSGVIPGWTQGIPGMKVGGRRELVIPGDLAYGANPPSGSGIQPNETLVFVIDLVAVQQ